MLKKKLLRRRIRGGGGYLYNPNHKYLPGWGEIEDDYVAVTKAALQGTDFWTDPATRMGIFVSDRLHSALKAQKLDKAFTFYRCRVEG